MTWAEFKAYRASLTIRQLRWLEDKARWEGMTQWAVLNEGWRVPSDAELLATERR